MLWLALYFPELPLEVFACGPEPGRALAVSVPLDGREQISRCNKAAASRGVRAGLPVQAALALHGGLRVEARDPGRERAALEMLAQWAYQFSNRIAFEPLVLLLEIGGSLRLFGDMDGLLAHIAADATGLGHVIRHAVAPTPMAAALLARTFPATVVTDPEALHAAVSGIPLARLSRAKEARELLQAIGLRTIGDCLALPRAGLARRAAPGLLTLLDRLLGRQPDPRESWQPPDVFEQRLELSAEVAHRQALVFPARRLVTGLCGYLRGRGGATQHLAWFLEHRDSPDTAFEQGMLQPDRDAERLLAVFRERVERVRLGEGVLAMRLRVDTWQSFEENTGSWLDARAYTDSQRLLERLGGRLGEQRVRGLGLVPDYRPEKAWLLSEPGRGGGSYARASHRPLWLLEQPRPLREQRGLPVHGGVLQLVPPPQRIETGWWDGGDVSRDYYIARDRDGTQLWVYQDRRTRGWYLHGLFD